MKGKFVINGLLLVTNKAFDVKKLFQGLAKHIFNNNFFIQAPEFEWYHCVKCVSKRLSIKMM